MKKYIDVSNEIKDKFKTGIQILDDVSNDIQEFLTLLQNSSGDTIELIKSDLTFLKDKFTTIKEKVEKRSMEIEERANTYDACLEPYIEKMNNGPLIARHKNCNYIEEKKIAEVQGPEEEDGIGRYSYKIYIYEVGKDDKEPLKVIETLKDISFSRPYIVVGMRSFEGGFWNASDYAMSSIALGVSQLSKVAPSTDSNSDTDKSEYTSNLWTPSPRQKEALAIAEDMKLSLSNMISRCWVKEELKKRGYTTEEIRYALNNVDIDWKPSALRHAQFYLYELPYQDKKYFKNVNDFLSAQGFNEEEIQYVLDYFK